MNQFSLVSFYSAKSPGLYRILDNCQQLILSSELRHRVRMYSIEQIHATLIGLEIIRDQRALYSKNYIEKNRKKIEINFNSFQTIITEFFPQTIRIGGFTPENKQFMSAGQTPYERSFGIDTISGKIVLMGWPHFDNDYSPASLLHFRKRMEDQCNTAHKYMNDNDLYMVLGELKGMDGAATETDARFIQSVFELNERVRQFLVNNPLDILLMVENLYLAMYTDRELPLSTTKVFPIKEHMHNLSEFLLRCCTT